MKVIYNQKEIPIDDNSDIIIEKFSPITNLEIRGEYALSFNNPVTPALQEALGFSNIPNIQTPITSIPVALFDDYLLFVGNLNTKSANSKNYQQELTATPGNVPLDIWKRLITDIDFGKDTIPTTTKLTNMYKLPIKELIGTSSSNSNLYTYNQLLGYKRTVLKFQIDGYQVYSHTFTYPGGESVKENRETELDNVISEFNEIMKTLNVPDQPLYATLERYADDWIMSFPNETNHSVTSSIRVEYVTTPFTVDYTFTRISYESIENYFDGTLLNTWSKPYLLPQIYTPNIYGDQNPSFFGNINAINYNKYYYNSELEPTKYTFCPALKFSYVLHKLFEYMGYTLDPSFFNNDNNDKLCWLTLVCADRQFPNLSKPFNIHANEIVYNYYMPKWTVREFLERFQNWLNVYFDFDEFSTTVKIIERQKPFVYDYHNLIDLSGQYDDDYVIPVEVEDTYQIKFAITDSDDESLVSAAFKPVPNIQTPGITWKEVENHFAPLIMSTDYTQTSHKTQGDIQRMPAGTSSSWNWSSSSGSSTIRTGILVCFQTGKSVMFGLNTEEPKSRSLFCSIESNTILTENTLLGKSLFIDGVNGIYQKQWQKYLDGLSDNVSIKLKVVTNSIQLYKFDFSTIFYAHNFVWIAEQISRNPRLKISNFKLRRIKLA